MLRSLIKWINRDWARTALLCASPLFIAMCLVFIPLRCTPPKVGIDDMGLIGLWYPVQEGFGAFELRANGEAGYLDWNALRAGERHKPDYWWGAKNGKIHLYMPDDDGPIGHTTCLYRFRR